MILQFTASADTYITNKIINNSFSASDANVGRAGTIDIFKLYNESTLTGTTAEPYNTDKIELSRALIKFDYKSIQDLTRSTIDFTNSSFKAELLMFDVMGGQGVPSNFTLSVFPLARKFDEGNGRDVAAFRDIDIANWYSSSFSAGVATMWVSGGANASGSIGADDAADYYASGSITAAGSTGVSHLNFECKQTFVEGDEDLKIDVTKLVSASLAGQFTNHGLRLSFTASEETDTRTRFVKRFGSTQARNVFLRPLLRIGFDDSIQDNHESFFFDLSGSIFLNSFERGRPTNIKSGSNLLSVTGSDSLILHLSTGSFSKYVTASQHKIAGDLNNFITGVYSASFAIWSGDTTTVTGSETIATKVRDSGSVSFTTFWNGTTGSIGFHTGSLTIKAPTRYGFNEIPKNLGVKITNLSSEFGKTEKVKLRVFITNYNAQTTAKRFPYRLKSTVIEKAYYRVRDVMTDKIIIPFAESNNGTRLSEDSEGMYFKFDMSALFADRTYTFDFKLIDSGETEVLKTTSVFKVV